ncbi:hypothetical protein AVEN_60791-1 [Araneus ventricosus]|uniref:Uncharacterized protein n=1 Tax=Araneus ventricosus TaxID=182803 RepID=A0A4Y2BJ25_ARAVE|nr:hypothetical protein AVEN_60791-1 [Araneus ventricosus]
MQIDKNQEFAQNCRKTINDLQNNGSNESLITSRNHELKGYETHIAECEEALRTIGPCPLVNCTKHHEITKDVEIAEQGQYSISTGVSPHKNPNPNKSPSFAKTSAMLAKYNNIDRKLSENSFKIVSRKNAAKPRSEENKSEIETSNKFQHLLDVEEQDTLTETPKILILAINLKLSNDYNLTLQEIFRNHPETTNKYDLSLYQNLPYLT